MKDTPLKAFGDTIVDHPSDAPWESNPSVPLDNPFVDSRGSIQNLWLSGCQSVAVIESRAETIRANHVHTTDWHATYVVSGLVLYYWRDEDGGVRMRAYKAGDSFFTPPGFEHAMAFPIKTTIVTCSRNVRDTAHHESDVRRVALIDSTVFDDYTSADTDDEGTPFSVQDPSYSFEHRPTLAARVRSLPLSIAGLFYTVAGTVALIRDRIKDRR